MILVGRLFKPFDGLRIAQFYAAAFLVVQAQFVLRFGIALFGRRPPRHNQFADRLGVSLAGGLGQPLAGLFLVFLDSFSLLVEEAKLVLRLA